MNTAKVLRTDLRKGRLFSDGKDLIFEIENYWFTNGRRNNKAYNPILVSVHRHENGSFKQIGKKEVEFEELKPLPAKPEYARLRAYNQYS